MRSWQSSSNITIRSSSAILQPRGLGREPGAGEEPWAPPRCRGRYQRSVNRKLCSALAETGALQIQCLYPLPGKQGMTQKSCFKRPGLGNHPDHNSVDFASFSGAPKQQTKHAQPGHILRKGGGCWGTKGSSEQLNIHSIPYVLGTL